MKELTTISIDTEVMKQSAAQPSNGDVPQVAERNDVLLVNVIEERFKKAPPVETRKFIRTMAETVSFQGAEPRRVAEVLRKASSATNAIDEAITAYDTYYAVIGKMPDEIRERQRAEKRNELDAHLLVIDRANQGMYNGQTNKMRDLATYAVGDYLISASIVAGELLEERQAVHLNGASTVVFESPKSSGK